MAAKSASTRAKTNVARKAASGKRTKLPRNAPRLSKVEAERLERFKALMRKSGGKLKFEGSDEMSAEIARQVRASGTSEEEILADFQPGGSRSVN